MNQNPALIADLTDHLALGQQALQLAQQENASLRSGSPLPAAQSNALRQELLSKLDRSLARLRPGRSAWQSLPPEIRKADEQVLRLVQANQDVLLRALVLSRESERLCLEKGLFSARELPAAQAQRPHFVSGLYRRHRSA
jgi:hypothetical protein